MTLHGTNDLGKSGSPLGDFLLKNGVVGTVVHLVSHTPGYNGGLTLWYDMAVGKQLGDWHEGLFRLHHLSNPHNRAHAVTMSGGGTPLKLWTPDFPGRKPIDPDYLVELARSGERAVW